ncbi:MAG: histone-like protein [Promethearchaeota archaeon]
MAKKKGLAWSPIRDLMKSVGAQIVARDAVDLLKKTLEERAKDVTTTALKITRHGKRTKISRDDVEMAIGLV